MKEILYVDLSKQWNDEKENLLPIIEKIFSSGYYVGGKEIEKFEQNIKKIIGTDYAVALNSGTDALTLGLRSLGIKKGDEVITVPNSFIATTAAIIHLGAKPVFVDVLEDQNIDYKKIESAITSKTKAIMPVHLTGRVCEIDEIINIAKENNLYVIEDAAQSVCSKYKNKYSGSFGEIGCFSTHPLKNLNSCGDGGFITTNNEEIYNKIKKLKNHGLKDRDTAEFFGYVSRMDNLQAAILNFRIHKLENIIKKRRQNAKIYIEGLNSKKFFFPKEENYQYNTYHTFVIQVDKRDELKKYLFEHGVETAIHYPIPIHLQPAAHLLSYKVGSFPIAELQAKKILSLPIHQYLKNDEIEKIINLINSFPN